MLRRYIPGIWLFLLLANWAHAERYHVVNYDTRIYAAGTQNWCIDLNARGEVFIANNAGILFMDGSQIRLLKMPFETIVRSVLCYDDRVYVGSFEEFGYWIPQNIENWRYFSLVSTHTRNYLNNDEFWKIVPHRGVIYFQSFGNIFAFDGQKVEPLELPGPVIFLLTANGRLFTQLVEGPLLEIIDNQPVVLKNSEFLSTTEVKAILPLDSLNILIASSSQGIYRMNHNFFEPWDNEAQEALKTYQLNNGIEFGEYFAFGTLLKGIFILNRQGKLIHHLHSGNSLQNNTVLALRKDTGNNLWVGLDRGVDYIWLESPAKTFINWYENPGAIYTAALYDHTLFIGSNQGVYYSTLYPDGHLSEMHLLENSQGQVWFLKDIDHQLYCGTNNGTFRIIDGRRIIAVSNINGGYNLKPLIINQREHYIQSTYNHLVIYRKEKGFLEMSHVMDGFMAPVRFLEIDHLGNLLLGHALSGIYLVQPSPGYTYAEKILKLDSTHGVPKGSGRLFKVDNRILIPTAEGFYQWKAEERRFTPYTELNHQLDEFATSRTIIPLSNDQYWFIAENTIGLYTIRFGKAQMNYRLVRKMYDLQMVDDYENIVQLNDTLHLICLEEGFTLLNLNQLNRLEEFLFPPEITSVQFTDRQGQSKQFREINATSLPRISNAYNNFRIRFRSSEKSGRQKYFQYQLVGIDDNWSPWNDQTEIHYTRLPAGRYQFRVRELSAKGNITPAAVYSFSIRKPWFLSTIAIITEIAITALIIALISTYYRRRKWKQREEQLKIENERIRQQKDAAIAENIRLTNEKLQAEVAIKNLQLAKNTMAIIRKNEALNEIKEELERQKRELGSRLPAKYYQTLYHIIERNISHEHDWQVFEQLFDQAHENFFQRLKNDFPELTPSDLRLCAYLRINLSSKEIAPLLNITVRGVEEKRYRLRKRLKLSPDQSLTDFIMNY